MSYVNLTSAEIAELARLDKGRGIRVFVCGYGEPRQVEVFTEPGTVRPVTLTRESRESERLPL